MKNSNDTIGNRTRDLPFCSKVPQPNAPLRAPFFAPFMRQNLQRCRKEGGDNKQLIMQRAIKIAASIPCSYSSLSLSLSLHQFVSCAPHSHMDTRRASFLVVTQPRPEADHSHPVSKP
jgi:hypothetical protein